ncbi:sensor histidine kinase [Desulfobacter curvatus]|uniref:sensor histidine kinase n=1 Tax=Desulfobacter curvatus TaxID=2290 RepID=UPI000370934E|nr:HAMP domain-containing sensor histidine kinase [Desulfobacter curvatus]
MISNFVTKRFHQRIDFMTQYLALNCELGLLIGEKHLLQGLVDNMLNEDDVTVVEIFDPDKKTLALGKRILPGPFEHISKKVFSSTSQEPIAWVGGTQKNKASEIIGEVKITYSVHGISELINAMKNQVLVSALALIFISCLIFHFISRSLVAPIVSLADTARKVSMGNKNVRAAPGTTPEIIRLSQAFNNMLDSLAQGRKTLVRTYEKLTRQEALVEVGKFSMMIAHEVKNPLGIIKSSLELIKSEFNIPDNNLLISYAEEEIVRLNHLIESFLMFSKPAKPQLAKVNLNQLVEQIVMGFDIQSLTTGVKLDCRIPESKFEAQADFDLLARGIGNIIKNACEANDNNGTVRIDVVEHYKMDKTPHKWEIFIQDQGPGISQEQKAKIFEPFFTTKSTGTGLGLAFADQAIKAHGGNIRIESPEIGGCCFCVTLFSNIREPEVLKAYDTDINS